MEKYETYHQQLSVRNVGKLTRKMKFFTDPNSDVSFKIDGNAELEAEADVTIDLYVEPVKKKLINRNRFFYILAEHPDIVWEIPILVLGDSPGVYLPELIRLHKVPANTVSFYQFVIYNPLEKKIYINICCNFDDFTVTPNTTDILANDYGSILISAKIPSEIFTTSLVVTVNNAKSYKICINAEPSEQLIHLSTSVLTFRDTYMGLKEERDIRICNKSLENVSFQWIFNKSEENMDIDNIGSDDLIVSEFLRIRNKRASMLPMRSFVSHVTLCPPSPTEFEYNEEEEPPLQVNLPLYLFCPTSGPQFYQLQVNANILGPNIEITPSEIDVANVYMGQIKCFSFVVVNKGPIPGRIYFKDHTDLKEVRCSFSPMSLDLAPGTNETVQLTFYRRDIGKFLTKIIFKIFSGNTLPVLLRGTSLPVRVKIWPEVFEFGNIPICIPHKRFALIVNPLPVPIVVEPSVLDDGLEDPLILCVDQAKLPLHARPATYYSSKCCKDISISAEEEELKPNYSDFSSNINTSCTTLTSVSQVSFIFQDKVLDKIPAMAENLLQTVKDLHSQGEPQAGVKIIEAALDCILDQSDYFEFLKEQQNYLKMDWKALPNDAREVAIEAERFYLQPNESKSFPVILIPNSCGPSSKTIQFKVCPIGIEQSELKTAVSSKHMVSGLRLQYKCMVPVLESNDCIKFAKPLFVDMRKPFSMKFKNIDVVPGFVFFKIIPRTKKGEMRVDKNQRKFFIATDGEIEVPCSVVFRQVGNIILHGLFNMVGKIMEYPFSIEADVIPPKIQIKVEKRTHKQRVLEWKMTRMFVENICPTVAKFTLSLKNQDHQFMEPLGGSLAPNQKILISIFSKFLDPGIYKNTINVHLVHSETQIIPLTYIVEGIPVKFEPDIKKGIDCGKLFRNDGTLDYFINIRNYGQRSYRLLFKKTQMKNASFILTSAFNISPHAVTLCPLTEVTINITLNTSKEGCYDEEYSVDGMGEDNVRFKFFTFTAKCIIIKSKVVWSKSEVCFEAEGPDLCFKKLCDTLSLTNTTPLAAIVSLKVLGPFGIYEEDANGIQKTLEFCLEGNECQLISIHFKHEEVEKRDVLLCFDGIIKCKVNNKPQKHLPLHAKIINPRLKIPTPKVTLFGQNADSYSHICIHNCSPLEAKFTWKPVTQTISKTAPRENCEIFSLNTVSEMILSLPEELTPIFPTLIKPLQSLPSTSDESSFDDDSEEEVNSALSQRLSLRPRTKPNKTSSESIETDRPKLPPLEVSNSNYEKSAIGIKEVLDFLGYPELLHTNSTNNTMELDRGDRNLESRDKDEMTSIVFQQTCGKLLPGDTFKAFMFLPPVKEGYTLNSRFDLEVSCGMTETLDVAITSMKGRVKISTTDIDLGRQMWYKILTGKVEITNPCPYAVKISLIENADIIKQDQYIISGYIELDSPKALMLKPTATVDINWKALLGLQQTFIEHIGIEINNNVTAVPIRFHGAGLIPLVTPKNIKKVEPTFEDTVASYLSIRRIYDDFKNENIKDESLTSESIMSNSSLIPDEEGLPVSAITQRENFKRTPIDKFIALKYSTDTGPSAVEMERFIETGRLLSELENSEELQTKFQNFYKRSLLLRSMEFDPVINLKLTICRPIPWEMSSFVLDIGDVQVNETKTFELGLSFLGPGKAFLSVRTIIPIPGLTAWFNDFQNIGPPNSFVSLMQSPEENTLKRYNNITERNEHYYETESQEIELHRTHSYDFDEKGIHKRQSSPAKAKKIKERYTRLSQPFKEKKNRLVLAEICQTSNEDWSNTTFKLNLIFTALNEFYGDNQFIEDLLLIDVHLGPTLPILLKGHVVQNTGNKA